jgi:hypothetical protein
VRGGGFKHGMSRTPEYAVWTTMLQRCHNHKAQNYESYGGRGILVADRWHKFENFIADMGRRPGPKYTLERKNNDLGYSPENCAWATYSENNSNRRPCRQITFEGETLTMKEWASRLRMSPSTIAHRLDRGMSVAEALDSSTIRQSKAHDRLVAAIENAGDDVVLPEDRPRNKRGTGRVNHRIAAINFTSAGLEKLDALCATYDASRPVVIEAAIELLARNTKGARP